MLRQLLLLPLAFSDAAKVYLCGDSTMAEPTHGGLIHNQVRVGWGHALRAGLLDLEVVNLAHSGASVRSYTNDGYFRELLAMLQPGDWMVCQFGHNELGSYKTSDKAALLGIGPETLSIRNLRGQKETILTYGGYLRQATEHARSKQANVLILSQTPEVNYSPTQITPRGPSRFVQDAHNLVKENPGYYFIDHFHMIAEHLRQVGPATSANYYIDNRHMNLLGAEMAAHQFIEALCLSNCPLKSHITRPTEVKNQAAGNEKRGAGGEERYVQKGDVFVPVNLNHKRAVASEQVYIQQGDRFVPTKQASGASKPSARPPRHTSRLRNSGHKKRALSSY